MKFRNNQNPSPERKAVKKLPYADFAYYQNVFKGSLIPDEALFCKYAERASEFIDTVTFDKLQDENLFNLHKSKIQKCICALTEKIFRRNLVYSDGVPDAEHFSKSSETIGAYSVSYQNPYEYIQEISMTDAEFQKSLKNTALYYLSNTGLLYRGVDSYVYKP